MELNYAGVFILHRITMLLYFINIIPTPHISVTQSYFLYRTLILTMKEIQKKEISAP